MGRKAAVNFILEGRTKRLPVLQLIAPKTGLQRADQFYRGFNAYVGGNQDFLQLIQRIGIDLLLAQYQGIDSTNQAVGGLLQSQLETLEEPGFALRLFLHRGENWRLLMRFM